MSEICFLIAEVDIIAAGKVRVVQEYLATSHTATLRPEPDVTDEQSDEVFVDI